MIRVGATLAVALKIWKGEFKMPFYNRKSIRLYDYDYSQEGGYFITICTEKRRNLLSHIYENGECERAVVSYTQIGRIAEAALLETAVKQGIVLDSYVIMPNHIHAIVFIEKNIEGNLSLGSFVGAFKSIAANRWINVCKAEGNIAGKLWQRNYYEHILRNKQDYQEKRRYIEDNPDKWRMDEEYVQW